MFVEAGWRSRGRPWERASWEHHALGGAGATGRGFPVLSVGVSAIEIGSGKGGLAVLGWRPFKKSRESRPAANADEYSRRYYEGT